ncbi:MAG: FecR domain-containing protein [Pseudomonadota bacterium]|nr:FecR domain-containing protein [Pseudomonadota bacterium]
MVLLHTAARALIGCWVGLALLGGEALATTTIDAIHVRNAFGWRWARPGEEVWAATLVEPGTTWERPLLVGQILAPGTRLRVRHARVRLQVDDCAELVLDTFSEDVIGEGCSVIHRAGAMLVEARRLFRVRFGTATAAVRGTRFVVKGKESVIVAVESGLVDVTNADDTVGVPGGSYVVVPEDGPASAPMPLTPDLQALDAFLGAVVGYTAYLPPLRYFAGGGFGGGSMDGRPHAEANLFGALRVFGRVELHARFTAAWGKKSLDSAGYWYPRVELGGAGRYGILGLGGRSMVARAPWGYGGAFQQDRITTRMAVGPLLFVDVRLTEGLVARIDLWPYLVSRPDPLQALVGTGFSAGLVLAWGG